MATEIRLTPTSYIVLGLIDSMGESTPYDLKAAVARGLGNFWSLQHAQLYSEPARLAEAGHLTERREQTGRKRKHYKVTAKGRRALRAWLGEPTEQLTELRDLALLKVFLGSDPIALAEGQLRAHRDQLGEYEELVARLGEELPPGARLSLDAGIAHEREWVRFWSRLKE